MIQIKPSPSDMGDRIWVPNTALQDHPKLLLDQHKPYTTDDFLWATAARNNILLYSPCNMTNIPQALSLFCFSYANRDYHSAMSSNFLDGMSVDEQSFFFQYMNIWKTIYSRATPGKPWIITGHFPDNVEVTVPSTMPIMKRLLPMSRNLPHIVKF